jgi:hypothetical protein
MKLVMVAVAIPILFLMISAILPTGNKQTEKFRARSFVEFMVATFCIIFAAIAVRIGESRLESFTAGCLMASPILFMALVSLVRGIRYGIKVLKDAPETDASA